MNKDIINIIIAGTGGQGVNSLYRVLLKLCATHDIYSKSALFKGGAQRHGTVHASIRLFRNFKPEYQWYSSQIMESGLDLLIGMEPWETVRYAKYIGPETVVISNTHRVPLFTERFQEKTPSDPLEIIEKWPNVKIIENFTKVAWENYKDCRMANYLMGKRAIELGLLPFDENDFIQTFLHLINMKKEMIQLLSEEIL
jgi:Pyruvate/2-oxoacid:ferredoxin oxidoreductase gamma subunit